MVSLEGLDGIVDGLQVLGAGRLFLSRTVGCYGGRNGLRWCSRDRLSRGNCSNRQEHEPLCNTSLHVAGWFSVLNNLCSCAVTMPSQPGSTTRVKRRVHSAKWC